MGKENIKLKRGGKDPFLSVDHIPLPKPFTGEMWSFLLVNALRCLTEEQIAGLCFDLYCRNKHTESIDKKIELLKLERQKNGSKKN